MLKLKLFVVLMVALAVGPGVWLGVRAQAGDQDSKKKVETKAKELPAEIPIPEARTDKVRLFQEQDERVRVEQQLLIEKFKASPEWRALEDRQKSITELMAAELSAALRNAGVEEKDYAQYTYDKATLKFKKKVEEPKK